MLFKLVNTKNPLAPIRWSIYPALEKQITRLVRKV